MMILLCLSSFAFLLVETKAEELAVSKGFAAAEDFACLELAIVKSPFKLRVAVASSFIAKEKVEVAFVALMQLDSS